MQNNGPIANLLELDSAASFFDLLFDVFGLFF